MRIMFWLLVTVLALVLARSGVTAEHVTYSGFQWGCTRVFWDGGKYAEGYPQAGTLGPLIGVRHLRPAGPLFTVVPYGYMFRLHSTVTTLACDTCYGKTVTTRSHFREIDLGVNVHFYPFGRTAGFYLGGGPLLRWGQSARKRLNDPRPAEVTKSPWFGSMVLIGYQYKWGTRTVVFFEPQFVFDPDPLDSWQKMYPPDHVNVLAGFLWK